MQAEWRRSVAGHAPRHTIGGGRSRLARSRRARQQQQQGHAELDLWPVDARQRQPRATRAHHHQVLHGLERRLHALPASRRQCAAPSTPLRCRARFARFLCVVGHALPSPGHVDEAHCFASIGHKVLSAVEREHGHVAARGCGGRAGVRERVAHSEACTIWSATTHACGDVCTAHTEHGEVRPMFLQAGQHHRASACSRAETSKASSQSIWTRSPPSLFSTTVTTTGTVPGMQRTM